MTTPRPNRSTPMSDPLFLGCSEPGGSESAVNLLPRFGNRHGLIAGATGTGKSVSLMVLAEAFSRIGTPVFMADVKGDIAGLAVAGSDSDRLRSRLARLGVQDWRAEANPVIFWDLYGKSGHPIRTTISEMGPILLARVLELNDTQTGVLEVVFRVADEQGLLLLDLDDLRALLGLTQEHAKEISKRYGLVSSASLSAIQRALLRLEQAGAKQFFGEPALQLEDLMRQDMSGRGVINILAAETLIHNPRLYSSFLLWLLSELFENLPEVGDLDRPKLVFIFDEAHLLFDDCPDALRKRVEQVVRLIRSKGVGVYFCSQQPDDVPDEILGQLGNRIQHALRAFTARDQKAVRSAAETFVANPAFAVEQVITQLAVGEALVSTLQGSGVPMPVERVTMTAPRCRMGSISPDERATVRSRSPVGSKYDPSINRESAYEILARRAEQAPQAEPSQPPSRAEPAPSPRSTGGRSADRPAAAEGNWLKDIVFGTGRRQGMLEATAKSAMRTVGNQLGRQLLRGLLGSLGGSGSRR